MKRFYWLGLFIVFVLSVTCAFGGADPAPKLIMAANFNDSNNLIA